MLGFDARAQLPPGVHLVGWPEFKAAFGYGDGSGRLQVPAWLSADSDQQGPRATAAYPLRTPLSLYPGKRLT